MGLFRVWSLFFVVPLVELLLLILLAHLMGWGLTILLTLASSVLGAWLAWRSARQWWAEVRGMWRGAPIDLNRLAEGVFILLAAALVVTPGPMTGIFGLLLLVPAVRRAVHRAVWRWVTGRLLGF